MHAKVTVEFPGKPDDEIVSRQISVGEILTGDLAKVAIDNKWAKEVPPNTKPGVDEEESPLTKELKGRTVDELKAFAVEKKVELGDATKKAAIIAVLVGALEDTEDTEDEAPAE